MKRVLLIALAVVVAVSLLVIPAFAAESYVFSWSEVAYFGEASLPEGTYVIKCTAVDDVNGNVSVLEIPPVITVAYVTVNEDDITYEYCEANSTIIVDDVEYSVILQMVTSAETGNCCMLKLDGLDARRYGISTIEFIPYSEPVTMTSLLGSIGDFFTTSFQWLGDVLKIVVNSPALTVAVLAMPIILISIAFLVKIRSL